MISIGNNFIQSDLKKDEIFVAIGRRDGRKILEYLRWVDDDRYFYHYLDHDQDSGYLNKCNPVYYKLTDEEKVKHTIWYDL